MISYILDPQLDSTNNRTTTVTALNDGLGNFQFPSDLPETFINGIENQNFKILNLVDWDQDGDLDIIDNSVGWRENLGSGNFSTVSRYLAPAGVLATDSLGNLFTLPTFPLFDDFNGDEAPDLLTSVFAPDPDSLPPVFLPLPAANPISASSLNVAAVILNNGAGIADTAQVIPFTPISEDALGDPISLVFFSADLNTDGNSDLIIPIPATDDFGNPVSLGQAIIYSQGGSQPFPPESFDFPPQFSSGFISSQLADFDGNGTLEFTSSPSGFVTPSPFGPEVSAQFDFLGSFADDISALSSAAADYDGDGDLDFLAQGSIDDGPLSLFLVRNLIVNETSGITFALQDQGLVGAEANPSSDPDADGRSNFEELIQGTDPIFSDSPGTEPFASLNLTPNGQLFFDAQQEALDVGITYDLLFSTDLQDWESVPFSPSGLLDSETLTQFISEPTTDPARFFKLEIRP